MTSCIKYAALCEGEQAPVVVTLAVAGEKFPLCATCLKLAELHSQQANHCSVVEHAAKMAQLLPVQ